MKPEVSFWSISPKAYQRGIHRSNATIFITCQLSKCNKVCFLIHKLSQKFHPCLPCPVTCQRGFLLCLFSNATISPKCHLSRCNEWWALERFSSKLKLEVSYLITGRVFFSWLTKVNKLCLLINKLSQKFYPGLLCPITYQRGFLHSFFSNATICPKRHLSNCNECEASVVTIW